MKIDFNTSQPIYEQITGGFERLIATGELSPGEKILSQRDLAVALKVNVNTVQRAYREMEARGLVKTLRGQGTFIASNDALVSSVKTKMQKEIVGRFTQAMQALGYDLKDALALVRLEYGEKKEDEEVKKE